ncbi:DDE_Tnp_1-associated [Micromonospora viridifaciens]|uniref:DDE_Tnp_1-associated n=1 Tax=Micromonospora viridifaciens TaxID=1881 RepID=A0A1C4Y4U3_MICVI|nr:transposase family protein [Micromonospora viridifaciens]SCF15626.1 DDE_Tnp_1-associated [Micromonospora viridifaciens]
MPALPSSLISSVSTAPAVTVPETAVGLPAALADLPDPRARRGVRHRQTVVVTAAVCAVVAGYRSYTAIADVPTATALALGIAPDRRSSEAMARRLLQALDPDLLTAAISGWLSSRTTATPPAGRRAIAVDGKTLRGSRTVDDAALLPDPSKTIDDGAVVPWQMFRVQTSSPTSHASSACAPMCPGAN